MWVAKTSPGQRVSPSMPGGPRRWLGWGGQKAGRRTGEGAGGSKAARTGYPGGVERETGPSLRVDGTAKRASGNLRS